VGLELVERDIGDGLPAEGIFIGQSLLLEAGRECDPIWGSHSASDSFRPGVFRRRPEYLAALPFGSDDQVRGIVQHLEAIVPLPQEAPDGLGRWG
jgi:hypothetical protein